MKCLEASFKENLLRLKFDMFIVLLKAIDKEPCRLETRRQVLFFIEEEVYNKPHFKKERERERERRDRDRDI